MTLIPLDRLLLDRAKHHGIRLLAIMIFTVQWSWGLDSQAASSSPGEQPLPAAQEMVPPFDNDPLKTLCIITNETGQWTFKVARKNTLFVGAIVESTSFHGYNGPVKLLIGINADNTIHGLKIIQEYETPGLGSKINSRSFLSQFIGKSIAGTRWRVRRDGGDIDAVTGATVSSRAVTEAVRKALDVFQHHRDAIASTMTP